MEQLTDSLRHTSARKQELETELRNFEQVCITSTLYGQSLWGVWWSIGLLAYFLLVYIGRA